MIDLDGLDDLHQGTTPGPWENDGDEILDLDGLVVAEVVGIGNPAFIVVAHRLLPALVAELRAAREVIDQARLQSRPHAYLRKAIAAYDKAVTS